jgi:hypothetical protein
VRRGIVANPETPLHPSKCMLPYHKESQFPNKSVTVYGFVIYLGTAYMFVLYHEKLFCDQFLSLDEDTLGKGSHRDHAAD